MNYSCTTVFTAASRGSPANEGSFRAGGRAKSRDAVRSIDSRWLLQTDGRTSHRANEISSPAAFKSLIDATCPLAFIPGHRHAAFMFPELLKYGSGKKDRERKRADLIPRLISGRPRFNTGPCIFDSPVTGGYLTPKIEKESTK